MTDASFYRANRCTRVERAGFTLVEIMVVVGIMAVLIALLMPALARVRESARRTKCAANLKDMGAAAQAFANANGGRFPMCYRMRDTDALGYPYYTPFVIAQSDKFSNDTDPSLWTIYGTSWNAWQQFGVTLATLSCPSSMRVATMQDLTNTNPEWGAVVWSNYMYVGGLTSTIMASAPYSATKYQHYSVPHWGTAVPAVTNADTNLSQLVLAADMVMYSGGTPSKPSGWDITGRWVINHVAADQIYDPTTNQFFPMPDFQNILYGDGHVAAKQRADFPYILNTEGSASKPQWNFSMIQTDPTQQTGGYMYWGELDAMPPPVIATPPPPGPPGSGSTGPGLPANPPPKPIAPPPFSPPPGAGPGSPVPIPGAS